MVSTIKAEDSANAVSIVFFYIYAYVGRFESSKRCAAVVCWVVACQFRDLPLKF
jgi:hypothetical protein